MNDEKYRKELEKRTDEGYRKDKKDKLRAKREDLDEGVETFTAYMRAVTLNVLDGTYDAREAKLQLQNQIVEYLKGI